MAVEFPDLPNEEHGGSPDSSYMNNETFRCGISSMVNRPIVPLLAMLAIAGSSTAARGQACGAATDTTAVLARAQMRRFSASTEPQEAWARRDAKVPAVDTSTIVAVTQNATCQKVLAAFNAKIPASPLPTKIYAVKVGAVYVATYPFSGHQRPWVVIDSKFKVLATFVQ